MNRKDAKNAKNILFFTNRDERFVKGIQAYGSVNINVFDYVLTGGLSIFRIYAFLKS